MNSQLNQNNLLDDEDNNDITPLIFDIEEIECNMSDIDEINKTQRFNNIQRNTSKDSVIHTPKDFPSINPSGKINESQSNVSSISYQNLVDLDYY